eukprot:gene1987-1495_t
MKRILEKYAYCMEKYPKTTMSLTASTTAVFGDVGAQYFEKRNTEKKYSALRTLKMSAYGTIFSGIVLYNWYKFLDKIFKQKNVKTVLLKTFVNQLTVAPYMNASLFFYVNFLAYYDQGFSKVLKETEKKIKKDLLPIFINSCKIWPAVNFVNFYFVPLNYRILFINFIGACWSIYVTFISYKDIKQ